MMVWLSEIQKRAFESFKILRRLLVRRFLTLSLILVVGSLAVHFALDSVNHDSLIDKPAFRLVSLLTFVSKRYPVRTREAANWHYSESITIFGSMDVIVDASAQLVEKGNRQPKVVATRESSGVCDLVAPDAQLILVEQVERISESNRPSEHCHWVVWNAQHIGTHIAVATIRFGNIDGIRTEPFVSHVTYDVTNREWELSNIPLVTGLLGAIGVLLKGVASLTEASFANKGGRRILRRL